jgi:hypothetical protein
MKGTSEAWGFSKHRSRRSPPRTLDLVIPTGAGAIATAEWRDPLLRHVAQAFDLAGATTQWVPHPSRAFREGWAAVRSHYGTLLRRREFEMRRMGSIATRPSPEGAA